MIDNNLVKLTDEQTAKIDFALRFVAALNQIGKDEYNLQTIEACISTILKEDFSYSDRDSLAASISLDMALRPIGGIVGSYKTNPNTAIILMSLITTAIDIINKDMFSPEVLRIVDQRL